MDITDVKGSELREMFEALVNKGAQTPTAKSEPWRHPLIGRRVLVRTYSAGAHIGTLASVNPDNAMECHLTDAIRLWSWSEGGLSLSAIAQNGVVKGRLNRTGEVTLTNAIEYIPVTEEAEATYAKFLEDVKTAQKA